METHRTRTVKAIAWSGTASFARVPLAILTNIVLYRTLGTGIIGLMAMLTTVIALMDALAEVGLGAGIIRKKDITDEQINDFFLINFYIAMGLGVIVVLGAPLFAAFYKEPSLTPYFRVVAVIPMINAFAFTSKALLSKRLEFKRLALASWFPHLIGSVATITLVLSLGDLVSLVIGTVFTVTFTTAMLITMARWKPKSLRISNQITHEMMSFSSFVYVEKLVGYAVRNLDRMVIGHYIGKDALALYEAAKRMVQYLHRNVARSVGNVVFPSLSHLQDKPESMRSAYLDVVTYMGLIAFPIITGMVAVSGDLYLFFYGEPWRGSIPLFRILGCLAVLQSIGTLSGPVFYALGRSRLSLMLSLLHTVLFVTTYLIFWRYGVMGITLSFVAVVTALYPLTQSKINGLLGISWGRFLARFTTALAGCLVMLAVVWATRLLALTVMSPATAGILLVQIAAGVGAYILTVRLVDRDRFQGMVGLLRTLRGKKETPVSS